MVFERLFERMGERPERADKLFPQFERNGLCRSRGIGDVGCALPVVIGDILAGHDSEVVEPRSDLDNGTGSKDELAVRARHPVAPHGEDCAEVNPVVTHGVQRSADIAVRPCSYRPAAAGARQRSPSRPALCPASTANVCAWLTGGTSDAPDDHAAPAGHGGNGPVRPAVPRSSAGPRLFPQPVTDRGYARPSSAPPVFPTTATPGAARAPRQYGPP